MKKTIIMLASVLMLAVVSCDSSKENNHIDEVSSADSLANVQEKKSTIEYGIETAPYNAEEHLVNSGETLGGIFNRANVNMGSINRLNCLKRKDFDFRRIRVGKPYTIYLNNDSVPSPEYIVYHENTVNHIIFDLRNDSLAISEFAKPITTVRKKATATIQSSMWNAIVDNNLHLDLSGELSEIYAWTIDFFGIQPNDSFTLIYDEDYVDSVSVGIGQIYAAVFHHNGEDFYAYHFKKGETDGYWDEKGNSLQLTFLRAPLKFSRISSGYGTRRHPITRRVHMHSGIDYAAPSGTPVVSIGDGKVLFAQYKGPNGHFVKIRHNSVYSTGYLHLRGYAKGIKAGARVKQGQVIGYVGSTGRSTGPHLDYRVWKNGHAINPLKLKSPPAKPVPEKYMTEFNTVRDKLNLELTQN